MVELHNNGNVRKGRQEKIEKIKYHISLKQQFKEQVFYLLLTVFPNTDSVWDVSLTSLALCLLE